MRRLRFEVRRRNQRDHEHGSIIILSSISMVMILSVSALVIDIGNARQISRGAQASADAAALAGAQELMNGIDWKAAVDRVKSYALFNAEVPTESWNGCYDPKAASQFGTGVHYPDIANRNTCISANSATTPKELRVTLPAKSVKTSFGSTFGKDSLDVSRSASATFSLASSTSSTTPGTGTPPVSTPPGTVAIDPPCVICLLDPTGTTLDLNGRSVGVVVSGAGQAGININSKDSQALRLSGMSVGVVAPYTGIVGNYAINGMSASVVAPPKTGIAPIADPLAYLPAPVVSTPAPGSNSCSSSATLTYASSGAVVKASGTSISCTISPGKYSSVDFSGTAAGLTLLPGTYVFTGSFKVSGQAVGARGNGVMMYFACGSYPSPCNAGTTGATLNVSGMAAGLTISPPTSGAYKGLSFFYDRNNRAPLSLGGTAAGNISGTIYAKSAPLSISGTSAGSVGLNSMIVAGRLSLDGTSVGVVIGYSRANNVVFTGPAPPTTTVAAAPGKIALSR